MLQIGVIQRPLLTLVVVLAMEKPQSVIMVAVAWRSCGCLFCQELGVVIYDGAMLRARSLAYQLFQSLGILQIYDNILKEQLRRQRIHRTCNRTQQGRCSPLYPTSPVKKIYHYPCQNCL